MVFLEFLNYSWSSFTNWPEGKTDLSLLVSDLAPSVRLPVSCITGEPSCASSADLRYFGAVVIGDLLAAGVVSFTLVDPEILFRRSIP